MSRALPRGVLMDGDEAGDALALLILAPHCVTRPFGGNHDDVNIAGRIDLAIVDVETVGEGEGCAAF